MLNLQKGGPRRFGPTNAALLARKNTIDLAAQREGRADPPGPRQPWAPKRATSFQAGGSRVSPFTPDGRGLLEVQLAVPETGLSLGGMNFEPGRRVMLQYDPRAGVLLHGGQRIEAALSPAAVHDPTEMGTFLAGYRVTSFKHDRVCPVVPVDYDEDKVPIIDSSLAFLPAKVKTDDDAQPAELPFNRTLSSYKVAIRRIAVWIPDPTARQVTNPNLNLKYVMGERAARVIHLDLELDTLGSGGLLTTTGNWNANNRLALSAGYQWGGPSGVGALSNPIADVRTLQNASAMSFGPSGGVMFNQRLAGYFLDHPKVRDYFRAQIGDEARAANVRAVDDMGDDSEIEFTITGLGRFMVTSAKYATTLNGVPDFIMPNDTAIAVRCERNGAVPMSGNEINSAQTFRRKGPAGVGFYVREVYISWRGAGGTLMITEEASVPKMTASIVGGIITGAYS